MSKRKESKKRKRKESNHMSFAFYYYWVILFIMTSHLSVLVLYSFTDCPEMNSFSFRCISYSLLLSYLNSQEFFFFNLNV